MTHDEQKHVINSYIAAYNRFDIDTMETMLHPEIIFKNVASGEENARAEGLLEFQKLAMQAQALFSTRCQTIKNICCQKDKTVVDIDYKGAFAINLPNGPCAGEVLTLEGRSEYVFKDGKIAALTDYS